jgi:hypothetical protein
VAGKRHQRTRIIAASQQGKLVAPLVFQGSCNTERVDTCFEKGLLPARPPGSVIVLDNARFHQSPTTQKLVVAAGLLIFFEIRPPQGKGSPDRDVECPKCQEKFRVKKEPGGAGGIKNCPRYKGAQSNRNCC